MAKFLTTQAISNELLNLIKEAKDKIILVSPYLKVNSQIKERIKTKSLTGTMSEIVIVFGKSELTNEETEWMKGITDLKVFEKSNLHAKCYMNEEKAIICSMNLYEYSQQNNIEMGILITKDQDKDAYNEIIEEINNIKINGNRKKLDTLENFEETSLEEIEKSKPQENNSATLSPEQKLKFELLREWRLGLSHERKIKAYLILTDAEINKIVNQNVSDKSVLSEAISPKKANLYAKGILDLLEYSKRFTILKVLDVKYQSGSSNYDKVKLLNINTNKEEWFDTKRELPIKNRLIGARLNVTWLNEYVYLD